jgi:photosystem II stability/assembly factor-like uncharacterized protein
MLLLLGLVALAATSVAFTSKHGKGYSWVVTPTGSTAHFRGLSAVSARVAWVSGYTPTDGVVFRTTDRGKTWQAVGPAAPGVQFRDIHAFDANHAVILSIGNNATDFRVYVTSDGGAHWTQTFTNSDPNAFYDCVSFFDKHHGLAVSDPTNGKFQIISTSDGGMSWHLVSQAGMPPALPDEAGFAASGECLVTHHGHRAWFGSGGGAQARVFRTNDGGNTWQVSVTPMNGGPNTGINGLAFRDAKHGIAVGGNFTAPTASPNALAITSDGGKTWKLATGAPSEYRSGVAWLRGHTAIDVGLSGSDYSTDGGNTWTSFDKGSFDTVDCVHKTCWASGANGRVGYLAQSK